jgi:hypothetical protein
MKLNLFTSVVLLGLLIIPVGLFAQAAEVNPYGGYVWPGSFGGNIGNFKGSQLIGLRGGAYVTHGFEIGGNYSWNNHFQPTSSNPNGSLAGDLGFPQGAVRAHIYEAEFTYNFAKRALTGPSLRPYVVGAVGGLTTNIKHESEFTLNVRSLTTPTQTLFFANDVLDRGSTFMTFSYGGGIKAHHLWSSLGLFGDIRGRTVPNFFGRANTWPELTGGLTVSWGEK